MPAAKPITALLLASPTPLSMGIISQWLRTVLSVAFMDLIPPATIAANAGRVPNLHPSLLLAYRGPTPILGMRWDETITQHSGLTLHEVTEGPRQRSHRGAADGRPSGVAQYG